jgi:hypothetical protein
MIGWKTHYGATATADPLAGTPDLVPPYGYLLESCKVRIDRRITSGFVAFRSAKGATFAERKATFIDWPILI